MSEHTIDTTTQPTAQPDDGSGAVRYRVRGSVPVTVTITAAGPDEASAATPAAISEVFAGLPGAVHTPAELAIGIPEPVAGTGTDSPARYRVPVTVHGHLDVTADDDGHAPYVALETLDTYLSGRTDVRAELVWAICHEVTTIADNQPAE